ncbi:MAG: hypothetical protein ABSC05_31290 [Candidatus Solibacter sp.]|jgi:hypothetical protein
MRHIAKLILVLIFVGGLCAGDRPITVSPAAERQLAALGLKLEDPVRRLDHKLVSFIKLVLALRNSSDRVYDSVALTIAVLGNDGNEIGLYRVVEVRDVMPGKLTQVIAHALVVDKDLRVTKVEAFQKTQSDPVAGR